jgi:ornithine--oxo-acid transaminase
VIPPAGWLARCAEICRQHNVLLIADEVQTGLGRTGRLLACEHEGVRPDGVILGKALGGGLLPVSAFLADDALMQVFRPATTAPPSAATRSPPPSPTKPCASSPTSAWPSAPPASAPPSWPGCRPSNPLIREVRGRGLLIGMELDTRRVNARTAAEWLLARGLMTKDTHDSVLRFAPPLIVGEPELEWAAEVIEDALADLATRFPGAQA